MVTLLCFIFFSVLVMAVLGWPYYNGKNKIVFELDDRYTSLEELRFATVEYLKSEGKDCRIIDSRLLSIDGEKYLLFDRNLNWGQVPVQQVVLKRCK